MKSIFRISQSHNANGNIVKTTIILILTFVLYYSCNEKVKSTNIATAQASSNELHFSKTAADSTVDKIVGIYYVDHFSQYLDTGFELNRYRPTVDIILYTFEFKSNGEIIFKDLTKVHDCGNGVLSIEKGKWKSSRKGFYTLTFDGAYALESKFHTVSVYQLVDMKNGDFKMKLIKVEEERKTPWEY